MRDARRLSRAELEQMVTRAAENADRNTALRALSYDEPPPGRASPQYRPYQSASTIEVSPVRPPRATTAPYLAQPFRPDPVDRVTTLGFLDRISPLK